MSVTSPVDGKFGNASSELLVQYFIYFICDRVSYSFEGHLLAIKLAVDKRDVSILEFIDDTRLPIDNLRTLIISVLKFS